jgi:hypothetical protein
MLVDTAAPGETVDSASGRLHRSPNRLDSPIHQGESTVPTRTSRLLSSCFFKGKTLWCDNYLGIL